MIQKQRKPKAFATLPEGYKALATLDLLRNKKQLIAVNLLSVVLLLLTAAVGLPWAKARGAALPTSWWGILVQLGIALVAVGCYITLHELVHGFWMKRFSGQKPKYGFKIIYAYAGSPMYFARGPYVIIALAPLVLWGLVLAAMCAVVPPGWFWTVFLVQMMNVSGAAGDVYVVWRMGPMPKDALVRDTGTRMTIYSKAQPEEA